MTADIRAVCGRSALPPPLLLPTTTIPPLTIYSSSIPTRARMSEVVNVPSLDFRSSRTVHGCEAMPGEEGEAVEVLYNVEGMKAVTGLKLGNDLVMV